MGQQKSTSVDCGSRKSTFIKPIKKWKIAFTDHKTCKFFVKTVKNTHETLPKKLVPISKKIKKNQKVLFVWLKGLLFVKLKTNMI